MASPKAKVRRQRAQPGAICSLVAALEEVDRFAKDNDPALVEGGSVDFAFTYTFILPGTGRRVIVTRKQLEGGVDGDVDWPQPGEYEIDAVDSEGRSLLAAPWRAEHLDREALRKAAQKEAEDEAPAQHRTIAALLEESRITIREQRAQIDAANRREATARQELNTKVDAMNDLQTQKNDAILSRDKALADCALARSREKEALDALAALEDEVVGLRPQMAMAIDHALERASEAIGFPLLLQPAGVANANGTNASGTNANAKGADGNGANGQANAGAVNATMPNGATHGQAAPHFGERGDDPPPAGVNVDPNVCVGDLLRATVLDLEVCRALHDQGVLSWDHIRALVWLARGYDVGPVPNWPEDVGPASGGGNGASGASASTTAQRGVA